FLWNLMALVHFMRPSLRKVAYAALSSAAWQEIRVRFGRDDNFVWERSLVSKMTGYERVLSSCRGRLSDASSCRNCGWDCVRLGTPLSACEQVSLRAIRKRG